MLLARLCRTASATTRTQSSFMLPFTVIKPAHSSKIQGIKLFAATHQELSSSSWIKKDDFQKNEANEPETDDPCQYDLAIHNFYKLNLKQQLDWNRFEENGKKCRYDRSPPDTDKRKKSVPWNQTDVHNYTLHYNIWKNIIEFSVDPLVSELKELFKKSDIREDDYCFLMAYLTIEIPKGTPEINIILKNKLL